MNANTTERLAATPRSRFLIEILAAIASLYLWTGGDRQLDSTELRNAGSTLNIVATDLACPPVIFPAY